MSRPLARLVCGSLAAALALSAVPAAADGIVEEPLARFEEPICPGVIGLKLEAAEQMVGRLRATAQELGMRTADAAKCEPNVIVAFLEDGQDYLQRLSERRPYLFERLSSDEKRELLAETGPVRAWLNTEIRTRDGLSVGRRENLVELPQAGMWSAHSRIYRPVRRDITSAMVLFDRDAIEGLNLAQLTDYAAMRAFARTFPADAAERGSILALFDSEEAEERPAGLTEFDMAYLDRLYDGIPNLPASARLRDLPGESRTAEE